MHPVHVVPIATVLGLAVAAASARLQTTTRAQRPDVRLYVADRYEGVLRLDPYSLAVLDTIPAGRRPHGLIVSPDRRAAAPAGSGR